MIDNLVDRLETLGRGLGRQFIIYNEAADEITRLRAENERLREALKPFAKRKLVEELLQDSEYLNPEDMIHDEQEILDARKALGETDE